MNKLVMKRKAKKSRRLLFYLFIADCHCDHLCRTIYLVITVFVKTGANIYNLHFSISDFSFSNYTGVMEYMNLPKYIWNTVIITLAEL